MNECFLFASCDFTWQTTQNTINDIIEARIWNMWDIGAGGCPTQPPTNNPTVNPSPPSAAPTHTPSLAPSDAPTQPPSSLYFCYIVLIMHDIFLKSDKKQCFRYFLSFVYSHPHICTITFSKQYPNCLAISCAIISANYCTVNLSIIIP
jgi:hypothetical protein